MLERVHRANESQESDTATRSWSSKLGYQIRSNDIVHPVHTVGISQERASKKAAADSEKRMVQDTAPMLHDARSRTILKRRVIIRRTRLGSNQAKRYSVSPG